MKKKILFIISILLTAVIAAGCMANAKPYSLETGVYCFEKAVITNSITSETEEKFLDEVVENPAEYLEWGWMFGFPVGINQDTEFVYTKDKRCFVLNGGLAYELVECNVLKLHFPRREGYDYGIYDVAIFFSNQKSYGNN